jgi:hypothetical protein
VRDNQLEEVVKILEQERVDRTADFSTLVKELHSLLAVVKDTKEDVSAVISASEGDAAATVPLPLRIMPFERCVDVSRPKHVVSICIDFAVLPTARIQADMRNTQKRLGKAENDLTALNSIRKEMDFTTRQISELAESRAMRGRGC